MRIWKDSSSQELERERERRPLKRQQDLIKCVRVGEGKKGKHFFCSSMLLKKNASNCSQFISIFVNQTKLDTRLNKP